MPRQNRLEVTPPPAHAHWGQTKAQISARGVDERGVTKQGCVMHRVGAYFTHLASNNKPSHQNLSLHAYEVSAHSGLSMSSGAHTQIHVFTHVLSLSRKTVFHYQLSTLTALLLSRNLS